MERAVNRARPASPSASGRITDSISLQQPLDVIELELRARRVAVALAQLLENAAGALHVGLERHLRAVIIAEWAVERVGTALRARPAGTARLAGAAARPLAHLHLLFHLLGEVLVHLA